MLIDLETGTVLNGPIVFVPDALAFHIEDASDSEIIEFAERYGSPV